LLVEFREWLGKPNVENTAVFLHLEAGIGKDLEDATKIIDTMLDHGSRYKQLESLLGVGVLFVLPTNIGETNWTRIITKTTGRMTEAVRLLSNTNIPILAAQHALLRQRIVGEKMMELWTSYYPVQSAISNPVTEQQSTIPQSSFAPLATWGDQEIQFMMGCDAFEQDAFSFE